MVSFKKFSFVNPCRTKHTKATTSRSIAQYAFGVVLRSFMEESVSLLVPEVAHAGEHHGKAGLVCGGDNFIVADGAARLDDGAGTGRGRL